MSMPPEADLAVAIAKIDAITSDLADLKASMKELASAVSRLAVVEERQTTTNESIGRAFKQIDALTIRLTSLEQAQPIQKQSSDFVQSAVKYIVAIVLGAVVSGLWRSPPVRPDATPPAITGK
jgi:polynucleotide 5'-kinase involved in rRNA processing